MQNLSNYNIQFVKLNNGNHEFEYRLDESFFNYFENTSIKKPMIDARVILYKEQPNMFNLYFNILGQVSVECDRCLDEFNLPISNEFDLLVKQTEKEKENESDITYLSFGDYQINIAKYLYDICLLAIPISKNCELSQSKKCNQVVLNKLKQLDVNNQNMESDPRWDELKKLINKKEN